MTSQHIRRLAHRAFCVLVAASLAALGHSITPKFDFRDIKSKDKIVCVTESGREFPCPPEDGTPHAEYRKPRSRTDAQGRELPIVRRKEEEPKYEDKSMQEQFLEAVQHARKLKGLDDNSEPPLSASRRKKQSRKAMQALKRKQAQAPGPGPEQGKLRSPSDGPIPRGQPTFSPGCELGDRLCDRRARQQQLREEHAQQETQRRAEAASEAAHLATVELYYKDSELAAALESDLEAEFR